MRYLRESRWLRAVAFGAAMAVAAGALTFVLPLRGAAVGSLLRTFYVPGFAVAVLAGRCGGGADVGGVLVAVRVLTPVFYGLVGLALGAVLGRARWTAAACIVVLGGMVGAAMVADIEDQRQRDAYAQRQRRLYWNWALERLESRPNDLAAHSRLAHYAFRYFGKPDVALREWGKVLALEGERPTLYSLHAHLNLAILHRRNGRRGQAQEHFRRYQELGPSVREAPNDPQTLRRLEQEYHQAVLRGSKE